MTAVLSADLSQMNKRDKVLQMRMDLGSLAIQKIEDAGVQSTALKMSGIVAVAHSLEIGQNIVKATDAALAEVLQSQGSNVKTQLNMLKDLATVQLSDEERQAMAAKAKSNGQSKEQIEQLMKMVNLQTAHVTVKCKKMLQDICSEA